MAGRDERQRGPATGGRGGSSPRTDTGRDERQRGPATGGRGGSSPRTDTARTLGCLGLALVVVIALVVIGFTWLRNRGITDPVPGQQRCIATADGNSVVLDLDQAHFASIIVGISVERGLPARAGSIAMATAYQETGIRNLDYGDRDSVGLFQQRPSQGWGTEKQLMNPYYATGKFYDALVRINGWRTDSINDVAQKVQISGHPNAYRQHESNARVLASVLAGHSPSGFSCLDRSGTDGDPDGMATSLRKTFGRSAVVDGSSVTITAKTNRLAWAYAHHAVANASYYGVTTVRVGDRAWQTDEYTLPTWTDEDATGTSKKKVSISLR